MTDPGAAQGVAREELLAEFDGVRARTEALASPLSPEDQTVQSMPDVSPTKWHRAHVTWGNKAGHQDVPLDAVTIIEVTIDD